MIERLQSEEGSVSYGLRMHTVEPVFGTSQQHYGLRWINTRGLDLANKVMLMAASAVNLKKLVKKHLKSLIWGIISLRCTMKAHKTTNYPLNTGGFTHRLAY